MDDHTYASTKSPCPVCDADADTKVDPLAIRGSDGKATLLNLVEELGDDL